MKICPHCQMLIVAKLTEGCLLRYGDLRHEAAAILLGHLPVQGEAEAGETNNEQGSTISEVFFIGDTHFGHRGISQFSETAPHRPFATIKEHDAELVRRWNSVVGPKDMVWHLGDICFGKRNGVSQGCTAANVGGLFFPQRKSLGIDRSGLSPTLQAKVVRAETKNSSFAQGSDDLSWTTSSWK